MKTRGLTDKEIENARKELHRKAQARAEKAGRPGLYMLHELWPYYTPAMKRQDRELDCREMINSCLAYGMIYSFYRDGQLVGYAENYVFSIGEERVMELLRAQQERFRTATVHAGVYTDAEGCSYNSITW